MANTFLKKYLIVFSLCAFIYSCNTGQKKPSSATANINTDTTNKTAQAPENTDTSKPNNTTSKTDTASKLSDATSSTRNADVTDNTQQTDSTKKYVFLTFDDGPQGGTMNVYHDVKALGLKATFFMVGLHATYGKAMHDAVDTIRNAYPQILLGNHSYTHAEGGYLPFYHDARACFENFMHSQASLNVQKKFIRLPGNSAWVLGTGMLAHPLVKPVCQLLDSAGYNVIGWDVEWSFKRDPSGHGSVPVQSAETMVHMVENALNNHHTHRRNAVVLLSHDRMFFHPNYSDSLYKFMSELKARNPDYIFETVENYPGAKK